MTPTTDCIIKIFRRSIAVELRVPSREEAGVIRIHSDGSTGLSQLEGYPDTGFSPRVLIAKGKADESIACLATEKLLQLEIGESRKIKDLSFVEQAPHLKKLLLDDLPGVTALPDFSRLPELEALSIYKLRHLADLEPLTRSHVRYLEIGASADKLSAARIAKNLLEMPTLETLRLRLFSLSQDKKSPVIRERLEKAGRGDVLTLFSGGYRDWPLT